MSDKPNIFASRFFEKNGNGSFLVRIGSNMKMVNGLNTGSIRFTLITVHALNGMVTVTLLLKNGTVRSR